MARLVAAMLLGMVSQGVMNLIMTSTPLAMVGCGLPVTSATFAIQWHIVGMYAPSFVTGRLISRFGILRVGLVGCAIFLLCGAVAEAGISVLHFERRAAAPGARLELRLPFGDGGRDERHAARGARQGPGDQ